MSPLSPKGFVPSMPSAESRNIDASIASDVHETMLAVEPIMGGQAGDIESAVGRLSQLAETVLQCIEEIREADKNEDTERTGDDEEVLECDESAPEAEGELPGDMDDKNASGSGTDDGEEGDKSGDDDGDQDGKQDSDGDDDKSNGKGSQSNPWYDAWQPPGFLIAPPPGVTLRRTYVSAMDGTRKQGKRHHRERRKLLPAARKNHLKRLALLRKLFVIRLLLLCLEALLVRMRMELQREAAQAQCELVRV